MLILPAVRMAPHIGQDILAVRVPSQILSGNGILRKPFRLLGHAQRLGDIGIHIHQMRILKARNIFPEEAMIDPLQPARRIDRAGIVQRIRHVHLLKAVAEYGIAAHVVPLVEEPHMLPIGAFDGGILRIVPDGLFQGFHKSMDEQRIASLYQPAHFIRLRPFAHHRTQKPPWLRCSRPFLLRLSHLLFFRLQDRRIFRCDLLLYKIQRAHDIDAAHADQRPHISVRMREGISGACAHHRAL